jgi:hypothetical protein
MGDPALRAELAALAGRSRNELIADVQAIATRHGYALAESEIAAEVDRQLESAGGRELNEQELERVAAGSCDPGLYNPNTFN